MSAEKWLVRNYGPDAYRVFCDLENDKRARKIEASLPGYIYPLSHLIWASLVSSISWDRILDVGANYGEFTLDALVYTRNLETQIVCFEPAKSTFPYLVRTLEPFQERVEINNFGISSEDGVQIFRESPDASGGSRILDVNAPDNPRVRHYPVSFVSLKSWLDNSRNILVKLDVEGHESKILDSIKFADEMKLCFFLEVNQININQLRQSYPFLDLYVFSKFRGKLIPFPSILGIPKFLHKYRDLYLQDAILIHSEFSEGIAAVKSIKVGFEKRLRWILFRNTDIYSQIWGEKN